MQLLKFKIIVINVKIYIIINKVKYLKIEIYDEPHVYIK